MTEPSLYRYDQGDLLEQRNTYFYSAFHGSRFLDAWAEQRARCATDENATVPEGAETIHAPKGQTDLWLDQLHFAFSSGEATEEHRLLLAKLIQRFEVTKRMHGNYAANFRPTDADDYQSLARYVAFAEVLAAAYRTDRKLQQINALLKCLDTLCALRPRLAKALRPRLSELVLAERGFVVELLRNLKVSWRYT